MINIYQLFPRLFGNQSTTTAFFGTKEQNGCGTLDDINDAALEALQKFGITHVWLTGIIRHASLTSYATIGIPESHPEVVKGRAGSPYAICDYYDIDPDLAKSPSKRMETFEALVKRMHAHGLKVIIDFVPNHLARAYQSVAKPAGVQDFGTTDDPSQAFNPHNNFYYLPGEDFQAPIRDLSQFEAKESYHESPAKVTGNNCFVAKPGIDDWYETVKLNYGTDIINYQQNHFNPVPDTWNKMLDILTFWASKGVDGFRSDMAEMVPVAFWKWVIPQLKAKFPELIMIAEIYQPELYKEFIAAGFNYLYDKVGLYNRLEDIIRHGHPAESISICWKMLDGLDDYMLRFMENHDEPRLASATFAGNAFAPLPAVAVSALMHKGPFMVYNGQESGENATGSPGYSGDDGRSSIFDYDHMPQHQKWMNGGNFDGQSLSPEQQKLRNFYQQILQMRLKRKALSSGSFYDLMWANPWYSDFDPRFLYAFLRYAQDDRLLVVVNFNKNETRKFRLKIPFDAMKYSGIGSSADTKCWIANNLLDLSDKNVFNPEKLSEDGIHLQLGPSQVAIYELIPIPKKDDNQKNAPC